jgi:TRAP-type C4-dicarboxylate transport system substrate-binding protein
MLDGTYKQANNMIDLKWVPLMAATVIDARAWDRIPAQYHADLLSAARKAGEGLRTKIRAADDDAVKEMKSRGLNIVTLTAAERAQWQSEVRDSYPRLRGTLAPADLFDQVLKLRDEFRARQGPQTQN